MSEISIQFRNYGGRVKGAFVDNLLLKSSTSILKRPKGGIDEKSRTSFWESFIDLSNIAEICCLHDTVHFLSAEKEKDFEELLKILHDDFLSDLCNEKILVPYSFMTIDDIQKNRIFNRWALTVQGISQNNEGDIDLKIPDENIKSLFAGCLAEELIGTPYFPCVSNSCYYVPASALILDMQIYSLLLQSYIQIKKEEAKKTYLRNLIGGIREPVIPPITTLILSKISSSKEFVEELLILRKEMKPLRQKMAELSDLADSDISMDKWLKQTTKLQKEINRFIQKYEVVDSRMEISRPNQKDFATLAAKSGSDSLEFSLDIKKILSLGFEQIIHILKRRRIKPLPTFKKKIGQIGRISGHLNRVFGIQFEDRDFHEINKFQSAYEKLYSFEPISHSLSFKNVSFANIPEPSEFRKGIEGILFSEWFDFDLMVKEFSILVKTKVNDKYPTLDQLLDMGFICLSSEAYKKAKIYFSKAIEINSNSFEAYHGLALTELKFGNQDASEAAFHKALSLSPQHADILNDFGNYLFTQNRQEESLEFFQKAIENNDQHRAAWSNLGGCLHSLGRYEEASKAFQKAITIDSTFAEPWYGLGIIAENNESFDEALKNFQQALKLSPKELRYWERLGRIHFKLKNYQQAVNALRKVIEEDSVNYNLLEFYANCLFLSEEYDKSIITFEKLSTIKPGEPSNYEQSAYALYELGRYDEAIKKFKEAFTHDSSNPKYLIAVGRIYLETSQLDRSVKHFHQMTKIFPDNAVVEYWLGNSLWENNKKEAALTHFKRCVTLGYNKAGTFYNYAVKLDRLQDFEAAILFYELALSIAPDDSESLANLAADLAEVGKLDEALINAQKACTVSPNDLINLSTLGAVYAQMGDLNEAKEIFEKIIMVADDSDSPVVQQAKNALQQISVNRH